MQRYLIILIGFFSFGIAITAHADTRIDLSVNQANRANDYAVFVDAGKVRVLDQTAKAAGLIFDSNTGQMLLLDHRRKAYLALTQARIDEISSMVETLGNIAQQQGGALGDLMSAFGLGNALGDKDQFDVRNTNTTDKVAGLTCKHIEVLRNGAPETTLCITDKLPIPNGDAATVRKLLDFSQQLATKAGDVLSTLGMSVPLLPSAPLNGFPLSAKSDKDELNAEISNISTEKVDQTLFQIPKGYSKKELPI